VPALRAWAADHRDDLIVAAMFVAARVVFIAFLGVRMDLVFLVFAPHLPDLHLLRTDLLTTVWYEHTQPPLFPLGVGALMLLSPFPDGITFQVAWLAMGLATALVVVRIARMLGLGRGAAFVAVGLVVTNPALVSIEFSANYDQPTILLVALLILFVGRYAASATTGHLAAVTGLGAVAVLTRTVFHPAWYLLLVAGLVAVRRPDWRDRRLWAVLALPAVAIGIFVVKNQVLYGEAGLTTWGGASLSKIAGSAAPPDERARLIADGTVSPLFGRPVFIVGYDAYADAMAPCHVTHPDVAVLAQPDRPGNPPFTADGKPTPNLNYECFLAVYRQQGDDAIAYAKADPGRFFRAQALGGQMFFEPALPIVFTRNLSHLDGAEQLWRHTIYPAVTVAPIERENEWAGFRLLAHGGVQLLPTVLLLDLAAIALAGPAILRLWRGRGREGGGPRRAALAVRAALGLTCLWVTVIGSAFEINENARYRLLIEPELLVVLAWAGQWAVAAVRGWRPRTADPGPTPERA
jgi:hypothetical protein